VGRATKAYFQKEKFIIFPSKIYKVWVRICPHSVELSTGKRSKGIETSPDITVYLKKTPRRRRRQSKLE
jgi:hypothetical protein